MSHNRYFSPTGGLPGQSELLTGRAVLTDAYAIIPRGTMTDIVTSLLPSWERTRKFSRRAAARRRSPIQPPKPVCSLRQARSH